MSIESFYIPSEYELHCSKCCSWNVLQHVSQESWIVIGIITSWNNGKVFLLKKLRMLENEMCLQIRNLQRILCAYHKILIFLPFFVSVFFSGECFAVILCVVVFIIVQMWIWYMTIETLHMQVETEDSWLKDLHDQWKKKFSLDFGSNGNYDFIYWL